MSDREEVRFEQSQFQKWWELETIRNNALWRIAETVSELKDHLREALEVNTADRGKWLSIQNDILSAGFTSIVEAIAKIQTPLPQPQPKMKGTIVADYQIPDDQPDGRVTYHLKATDSEGQEITDPAEMAKIGFTLQGTNDDAFVVTLDADQPDPFNRTGGYHSGAPGQSAITANMTNAAGELIGTGTDSFTVTTGAAKLGSVESSFDGLTPIGG